PPPAPPSPVPYTTLFRSAERENAPDTSGAGGVRSCCGVLSDRPGSGSPGCRPDPGCAGRHPGPGCRPGPGCPPGSGCHPGPGCAGRPLALVATLVLVPLESTLVPLAGAPVALAGALVPLAALISTLALIAAHAEVIAGRVSSAVDLVVVLIAHAVLDLLRGRVEPLVDLVLVALREVLRLVHCVVEDHVGVLSSSGSSRVREVRPSYDGPRRDTN